MTGGKAGLLSSGVVRTTAGGPLAACLGEIGSAFESLVERWRPDEAAVEDLFHAVNPKSSLKLAHARGVILSVLARAGLPVAEYTPVQVKKAVCGYGLADKDSLRGLVERLLGAPGGLDSRDASDAAAVALCHAQALPFRDALRSAELRGGGRLSAAKRRAASVGRGSVP